MASSASSDVESLTDTTLNSWPEAEPATYASSTSTLRADAETPLSHTTDHSSVTEEQLWLGYWENEKLRGDLQERDAINERLKREGSEAERSPEQTKHRFNQLNHEISAEQSGFSRQPIAGLFKQVCSTDLLFLIDTTSSMRPHINTAKQQVISIINDIRKVFLKQSEVRIAIVGYKDHRDTPHIQFLDFTPHAATARAFLSQLKASGGEDTAEDVLGGINQALKAGWKHQTRCIIHIADAPAHGSDLNNFDSTEDFYQSPGSEPHKLTYIPILEQMIDLSINYALLRINPLTDLMAFAFFDQYLMASADCKLHTSNKYHSEACQKSSKYRSGLLTETQTSGRNSKIGLLFEEQQLGTTYTALRHLVVRSVTASATQTANRLLSSPYKMRTKAQLESRLMSINEDEDDEEADKVPLEKVPLEKAPPQWDKESWFNETLLVDGFCPSVLNHGASTLDEMMAHDNNIKMDIVELTVHKQSRPFAKGALRTAFYARTAEATDNFVVKSSLREGIHFAHVAEEMKCQALCKAFALEFNALVGATRPIDFLVTTCLKGKSRAASEDECLSLEPWIEGTYVKYNDNRGGVGEDPTNDWFHKAAQAFSHFTFERSRGKFLVCDLQGVGGLLTDPAIHTRDPSRFKLSCTNLNEEGFKFFFFTHMCNDICSKLELKSNREMVTSGRYNFRKKWSHTYTSTCCSNKLCGKILQLNSANKSAEFPGSNWCDTCWPQLRSSVAKLLCTAPGPNHEFEVSRFFYQSQGRKVPRKCQEHNATNMTTDERPLGSNTVPGTTYFCGAIWRRPVSTSEPKCTPRAELPKSEILPAGVAESPVPIAEVPGRTVVVGCGNGDIGKGFWNRLKAARKIMSNHD